MKRNGKPKIEYSTLFWLFFFGSVTGFVLEGIWRIILLGHWENHAATVWGPFCLVYGVGAVVIYVVTYAIAEKSFFVQFLVFAAAGSAVEYAASYLQELIFGSRSWDYSGDPFNLNGRITLHMTAIWGLLGVAFAKLAFPLIEKARQRPEKKFGRLACVALSAYMAINLLVTGASVYRWSERIHGIAPQSRTERLLDQYFDDDRMMRVFSDMVFDPSLGTSTEE